jgi:hypothetical protein
MRFRRIVTSTMGATIGNRKRSFSAAPRNLMLCTFRTTDDVDERRDSPAASRIPSMILLFIEVDSPHRIRQSYPGSLTYCLAAQYASIRMTGS